MRNRSGSHVPLGACELSVDTMLAKAGGQSGSFNLSTGRGAVVVHGCRLVPQPRYRKHPNPRDAFAIRVVDMFTRFWPLRGPA